MTISGKNKIELDDILIGDVWIGSGQSNMEMGIAACDKAKEEIAAANYPKIRLLLVPKSAGRRTGQGREGRMGGVQPQNRCRRRLGRLLGRALLLRPAAAQGIGRAGRADRQLLGRIAHRALDGRPGKTAAGCTTA